MEEEEPEEEKPKGKKTKMQVPKEKEPTEVKESKGKNKDEQKKATSVSEKPKPNRHKAESAGTENKDSTSEERLLDLLMLHADELPSEISQFLKKQPATEPEGRREPNQLSLYDLPAVKITPRFEGRTYTQPGEKPAGKKEKKSAAPEGPNRLSNHESKHIADSVTFYIAQTHLKIKKESLKSCPDHSL